MSSADMRRIPEDPELIKEKKKKKKKRNKDEARVTV